MLVDQNYSNVLSFLRKSCECFLYLGIFGLLIDHEEVPLRVRGLSDMANAGK